MSKTYYEKVKCFHCKQEFYAYRLQSSSGRIVGTRCKYCKKLFHIKAGPVPDVFKRIT